MMRLPQWVPYRYRDSWDTTRLNRAVRGLRLTPPMPAAAPEAAAAEVHLLVCRRDLRIAALAAKSLLRFPQSRFAVTVTDDGSLSAGDRSWFDGQIPGCRWLPARVTEPTFRERLAPFPNLVDLYAGGYQPARKLLHPVLLSRCDKVIVLDPDTAFFRSPDELFEWIDGDGALYLCDDRAEPAEVPAEVRDAFARFGESIRSQGGSWEEVRYFFNSGLLAFPRRAIRLEYAEKLLAWRRELPESLRQGMAGIWFGDWTPEQTAYRILYCAMGIPVRPFGEGYRIGGGAGHVFNHFLRKHLVTPETLRLLSGLVEEMRR